MVAFYFCFDSLIAVMQLKVQVYTAGQWATPLSTKCNSEEIHMEGDFLFRAIKMNLSTRT
jgi:hypothetical protein